MVAKAASAIFKCALFFIATTAFCAEQSFEDPLESYPDPVQLQSTRDDVLRLLDKPPVKFDLYQIDRQLKSLKWKQTQAMGNISSVVSEVVAEFFKGFVPNSAGVERPNLASTFPAQFVKRINKSRFSVLLQGMNELKYLNGPYYYNEMQGGLGVQYDFYAMGPDGDEEALVAIRWTPAYGEIAWIRTDMGARKVTGLPSVVSLGSSAGIEAFTWVEKHMQIGAAAYARPQHALGQGTKPYFTHFEQVYTRVYLNPESKLNPNIPMLLFSTYLSYFNRGKQETELGRWIGDLATGEGRNYRTLSESLEGMLFFEVLFK